ncbi:aminotransferase class I/II-fold pyridoxal phosphate-dependent enzyme [Rhodococcus sp. WS4]|nr:aminotransferase class I/II-fold pyridoxal phosphate-dependent enzyme [Rhodococcus sp. WS4]
MTVGPRLDVTTALFLDLRHQARTLPAWESLTTGVPAALAEDPSARHVAGAVAGMQGVGAGVVARSTLHALIDIFTLLPRSGDTVAVDEAAYPTVQVAAALARKAGAQVWAYGHHRPDTIADTGGRVFIATDGWCPGCNRPAPIGELRDLAVRSGGLLVVDDSLACGVLGRRGHGGLFGDGTGTARWLGASHDGVLWVASFAKAYGAPLAVVTGPPGALRVLRNDGNRLHSSAPSAPDLSAAVRALSLPRELNRRRRRLQGHVVALRSAIARESLPLNGLPFPIVGIPMPTGAAARWWEALRAHGIDAIVQRPRCRRAALLSFVLSSRHSTRDIERLMCSVRRLSRDRRGAAA